MPSGRDGAEGSIIRRGLRDGRFAERTSMSKQLSPYTGLPPDRFWKSGVSEQVPTEVKDIYRKKFAIKATDRVVTAGSCFAQHISRQLKLRGFNVQNVEPAPPGMTVADANQFGYGLYSARYGNIYHVRQLLQLALEAAGENRPADAVWEKDGRYYDALRPSVEPEGHASADEVRRHRQDHLARVRKLFGNVDVFVFTFGLTEAWVHQESGTVYPVAPGTIAGSYDPAVHAFRNFGFNDIHSDFVQFRALLRRIHPQVRFLVTVSPVPLTATATPHHVLAATTYSKSVLRAVAGQLADEFDDVDYFPSYELIATPFSRAMFYHPNLRSVTQAGVENAMRVFFSEHGSAGSAPVAGRPAEGSAEDVICEEVLLEAFQK